MRRGSGLAFALLLVVALAFAMRSLGFEWVFVDADTVVFAPADAQYHVRRVLYVWTNFPDFLFFDRYVNYPDGAAVSWPPLFDFTLAAAMRLLARDPQSFERIVAWAPPVIGSLAVLPVFALARRLGGPGLGLGAAALLALFPVSVTYSRVAQLDHHCAVAGIGACLLYVVARLVAGEGKLHRLGAGLAAGRVAVLLTWHGSLLHLALVEGVLWVAAAYSGRRELYGVQAWSALATATCVAPLVWIFPEPLGGAYSGIALSRLHVLAVVAVALVSAGLWALEGRSDLTPGRRLAATAGLGLAVVAALAALPGPREGLEPALRFLTMTDAVGARTGEQLPLFPIFGRATGRPVTEVWGLLGYAIPLLPFAVVWAAPSEKRALAWVVAAWCGWFGVLAVLQRRYGNDLAPAAAVGFAYVIAALASRTVAVYGGPRLAVVALQIGVALGALLPPLWGQTTPRLASGLLALSGGYGERDRALLTVSGSLTRFLQQVREVTPETSGFFDAGAEPEYGIAAHPNFGHAIQNVARRPTPADPFWSFAGVENWNALFRLLGASNEALAVETARELRARYVMTFSSAHPDTVEGWLHQAGGRAGGPWSASEHFRLVTEGPAGGQHFAQVFQVQGRRITGHSEIPYRLFEVVEGAVLEVPAAPGEEVSATLELRRPDAGELVLEWKATASDDGVARLRVPYSTEPATGKHAVGSSGPYRVRVGGATAAVKVPEGAVLAGGALRVDL